MTLFNAPQIKSRISKLIESVFVEPVCKDIVFAICLLEVLDLPLKSSFISEVSFSDEIYSSKLRDNYEFCQLFSIKNGEIISKSSVLSGMLLRDYFSPSYVINRLLDVVEKFEKRKSNSYQEGWIFKSLMRFSVVERMLQDNNKKRDNLKRYYHDLKLRVPWLQYEPHYWLQYAMSKIMFEEYDEADANLAHAYSLAKNKREYYVSYIDTQKAHVLLKRSTDEKTPEVSFLYFDQAHNLLSRLGNDVYKFRQVILYEEIYLKKYADYSQKNKVAFEHACNNMRSSLEDAYSLGFVNIPEQIVMTSAMDKLTKIQRTIENIRTS